MKKKKKKLWKWPVNWSFSELFYLFFFVPPTLNLKKNSRKSTNKKILALIHYHLWLDYFLVILYWGMWFFTGDTE